MKNSKAWMYERIKAARGVLEYSSDEQAIEALRCLGELRSSASANMLGVVAKDPAWPLALRIEAVQALGSMNTSEAAAVLKQLLSALADDELREQVVAALGNQPWESLYVAFEQLLGAPETPPSLRVSAVEALSRSTPEALPALQRLVAVDADADVRAAAAWAMSCIRVDQSYGPALAALAKQEPEIMVRRRIYEALLVQASNPAVDLAPVIHAEQDVAARVAGLNALGDAVSRSMDARQMSAFDTQDVPDLMRIAFSDETLNLRMRAVFALRRAGTPGAMEALAEIAKTHPTPQVARAASNGIKTATL